MLIASGFSWFHLLPGGETEGLIPGAGHYGYLFYSAWFVCLLLVLFALAARIGLQSAMSRDGFAKYEADEAFSARTVAEVIIGGLRGLMADNLEAKYVRSHLPLVATLALYIFCCNILAILPGFQPPTDNINTNVGMSIIVFCTFVGAGLIADAVGFIKHLMGPVLLMAPLMFLIEFIGLFVRPVSLSIRLTGNIFGDHTVYNIMSGLVPIGIPVIFLALATLVSVIQAGVFALLTTIYIALSLPHGDHDDHH